MSFSGDWGHKSNNAIVKERKFTRSLQDSQGVDDTVVYNWENTGIRRQSRDC